MNPPEPKCSFCLRPTADTGPLVAGPRLFICRGCIAEARALRPGSVDCSFCGETGAGVQGPGCAICSGCARFCATIFSGEAGREAGLAATSIPDDVEVDITPDVVVEASLNAGIEQVLDAIGFPGVLGGAAKRRGDGVSTAFELQWATPKGTLIAARVTCRARGDGTVIRIEHAVADSDAEFSDQADLEMYVWRRWASVLGPVRELLEAPPNATA